MGSLAESAIAYRAECTLWGGGGGHYKGRAKKKKKRERERRGLVVSVRIA